MRNHISPARHSLGYRKSFAETTVFSGHILLIQFELLVVRSKNKHFIQWWLGHDFSVAVALVLKLSSQAMAKNMVSTHNLRKRMVCFRLRCMCGLSKQYVDMVFMLIQIYR